jgi:AraC family transcriptional regulator
MSALRAGWRKFHPQAIETARFAWEGGAFDAGHRALTATVEGNIQVPRHLVMVTLAGGADHIEVRAACGHRHAGSERAGSVSIVPADCERWSRARAVRSEWASLEIDPSTIERSLRPHQRAGLDHCRTNLDDLFLRSLVTELHRLHRQDGVLDASYCDALAAAAGQYLLHRYATPHTAAARREMSLTRWQLNRIAEHVDAHLDQALRIHHLAALLGLSEGHFHRAFRETTGMTPLEFINRHRIRRAAALLDAEPSISTVTVALQVGYTSPSYFARTFRRLVGVNPAVYRARSK